MVPPTRGHALSVWPRRVFEKTKDHMTFDELGLSPKLLTAISDAGYTEPTPIQAGAIPAALTGRDVLGIAQTGTGKTASFVLPLIEKLSRGRARARMPRSLIVAPTRELAAQCAENFEKYAKGQKLTMALLIGGVAFGPQEEILNKGADVLIATPGRLLDHFGRGKILMSGVQMLVVDEADRMLDMGFIPDLEKIFSMTPPRKQTLFFSATMPKEIQNLVAKFLKEPERIEVARPATTSENIKQFLVRVPDKAAKAKRDALRIAMQRDEVKNGIIFANRKRDVDVIARSLQRHEFSASPIHGDLDQSARTATLADFKSGKLRFLVASDVAARGLDIPDVSHVFNYDVPHNADDYVHRIGRTGRAGKTGESVTLIIPGDEKSLAAILKLTKQDIPDLPLPGANAEAKPGEADAAAPAEKPKRSRSRRKPAADKAPEAAPHSESKPEQVEEPAQAAKSDTPPAAQKPSNRNAQKNESKTDKSESRSSRSKSSRRRGGGDDLGPRVKGFGDHVPEFINTSAMQG
jgi:superfamily II DNA/RNA helicase